MNAKPGDVIRYQAFGGVVRRVRVTAWYEDVKNGRPGFDGQVIGGGAEDGEDVWGYADQIV